MTLAISTFHNLNILLLGIASAKGISVKLNIQRNLRRHLFSTPMNHLNLQTETRYWEIKRVHWLYPDRRRQVMYKIKRPTGQIFLSVALASHVTTNLRDLIIYSLLRMSISFQQVDKPLLHLSSERKFYPYNILNSIVTVVLYWVSLPRIWLWNK